MDKVKDQVRLCLGWHRDDNGDTWHAFRLEDVVEVPQADQAQLQRDMAKTLDVPVGDVSTMVSRAILPQTMIDRIKAEGVKEYLESREEPFRYRILQMKTSEDGCFRNYAEQKLPLRNEQYQEVYTDILPEKVRNYSEEAILEFLFALFNSDDRPAGKTMRSMSISDVVIIRIDDVEKAYFCDIFGFKPTTIT